MKLSASSKKNLLSSASKVYLAYTALDFFKSKTFTTSIGEKSIADLCREAIASKIYDQNIQINNVNYRLVLTPGANGKYQALLTQPIKTSDSPVLKKIAAYTDQEALNVLINQEFTLDLTDPGKMAVANKINDNFTIGGAGTVELYRTHLVTLHNIMEKIEKEEDISNLLVALATGSGKTYVQALWILVLSVANSNGVFAIPDKLVNQFVNDLKNLLPPEVINKILVLRDKKSNEETVKALQDLDKKPAKGQIIVGSSERLLDEHYQDLLKSNPEHTFLAFDEQHLLMQTERRRVRLIELSKAKLSMFLTATPNQETYKLCGSKPVAIMSSGQKQDAGQGQFPRLYSQHAQNISDKNSFKDYRFWTGDFWQTVGNKILLFFIGTIQVEHSSAAVSLVENLPFYFHHKKGEDNPRWSLQVPAARKMLCIVDDNETLVNFCYALTGKNNTRRDVYYDGNVVNRGDVANFFQLPDPEVNVVEKDMLSKREDLTTRLPDRVGHHLAHKSLADQLKSNIFHNLIEYLLTDITGLSEIEHNSLRKRDLNEFIKLVKNRFKLQDAAYYEKKLAAKIDPQGAKHIARLLAELSTIMNNMMSQVHPYNETDLKSFIDNWPLLDDLMHIINDYNYSFASDFNRYADKHLIIGVMSGMSTSETPIEDSVPFTSLDEERYALYDSNGAKVPEAKKRKNTPLEILNETSRESKFTPCYLRVSEEIADNYFRLGFVGVYASNKKTEGFSDRNLHTVINIANTKLEANNSPESQIQGIGRNRGLDDTIEPAYIHAEGREQRTVFDLTHLQSDDYYPALFKAQQQFNYEYIERLGIKVSKDIIAWIHNNMDADETLDADKLKRHVLKSVVLALRDLNNKSSHQIKLSRAQLTSVVSYAMKDIDREIAHINKPYQTSLFITGLGHFLNFICECYYSVLRIPASCKTLYHSWFGNREHAEANKKHPDDVYIKIISKTSFKGIVAQLSSLLEFKNWLAKKSQGIKLLLEKNVEHNTKQEFIDNFKKHQKEFLEPMFAMLVVDSKKQQVIDAIAKFPQFITFFSANKALLKELTTEDKPNYQVVALSLLRKIPGLENLTSKDIFNFHKTVKVFSSDVGTILNSNPSLQKSLQTALALYVKEGLPKYLSAFVPFSYAKQVQELLQIKSNADKLANVLLNNKGTELSPEVIFNILKNDFNLKDLKTLDEEQISVGEEFTTLQAGIAKKIIESLNDVYKTRFKDIIKKQFLPILVNVFPLEQRAELLKKASTQEALDLLINQHGAALIECMKKNSAGLPAFVFSKTTNPLPPMSDPLKALNEVSAYLENQFKALQKQSIFSTVMTKLTSWEALSLNQDYISDVSIANILQSDEFLNKISPLFPFDQWQKLKEAVKKNYRQVLAVTRSIIDAKEKLDPQKILGLFNKHLQSDYKTSDVVLAQAEKDLGTLTTEVEAAPLMAISAKAAEPFINLFTNRVTPLLAAFIKEDAKKAEFIKLANENKAILQFINKNLTSLDVFNNKDLAKMLGLLNELLPKNKKLVLTDICDPTDNAEKSQQQITKELTKIHLVTLINSVLFADILKILLNPHDAELVIASLTTSDLAAKLAEQLVAKNIDISKPEAILEAIKVIKPELKNIVFMKTRQQSFQDFITKDNKEIIDFNKLAKLAADVFTPVLFQPQFMNIIDELLGFLNEQDVVVLLEGMNRTAPQIEAKQVLEFIRLVRSGDKAKLQEQFFTLPQGSKELNVDSLLAKKVIDTIQNLIEEVLDCHCYYNQHDRRGQQGGGSAPKIRHRLSPELSKVKVAAYHSFFSQFSRSIFYIQGINNGISAGGKVSAASNAHIVKQLQRVKSHILRPLWWSTSASNLSIAIVKTYHRFIEGVAAAYYSTVNGFKSFFNWISRSSYFTISAKNVDSEDYSSTAFDFAEEVNKLEPFTAEQVKEKECHKDVVIKLEDFVAKRKTRPGFFDTVRHKPVDIDAADDVENADKRDEHPSP